MVRRMPLCVLVCICSSSLYAQHFAGVEIHGFATQGILLSSNNNYLTMNSSDGSVRWTDGAVSFSDSLTEKLRVGIQLHMYQLGELGGPHLQIDWASADYRFNDHFGIRGGKVKTVFGLFNDSQDVDAIFLWTLLPQSLYPTDNESFFLAQVGGEVYGELPLGGRAGRLSYDGYAGQSALPLEGGLIKQIAGSGLMFTTSPRGKTYGGDLRWKAPFKGLILGSSGNVKAMDGTAHGGSLHVIPFLFSVQYAQFTKGKFSFAGEYQRTPVNAILSFGPVAVPVPLAYRSWYAMGSYRLSNKVQVGGYYSHYASSELNTKLPANYSNDRVVSGRYDFNPYFYGKIEGHFQHGTGLGYYESNNPNGLKANSNMLAAKIGFSF